MVATTAARRRLAEECGLAEFIKTSERVLGAYTASRARQLTEGEQKRVDKGRRTIRLLASAGLPFQVFHRAVACYAMPAVSYGWLARAPTLQHAWSLFSQVRSGGRVCRLASRFIRACLLGGNSQLEILAAKHLLKAVLCRDSRSIECWSAGVGHPVCVLRGALMRMGWLTPRPWYLKQSAGFILDLRRPGRGTADKLCHVLRGSWRAHMWQKFLDSGRHECADWAHLAPNNLWARFRRINFEATRRWMHSSPEARSVALMGVVTPAWGLVGPTTCPWNCGRLGHWRHVVFQCRHRPAPQCCKPQCPWTARCGWVVQPLWPP